MRKALSFLLIVVLLFSLTACKKEPEAEAVPSASLEPVAKEEAEEAPVKEFSDGRLWGAGDIVSFAETENYYYTLERLSGTAIISCYTKDGELVDKAVPRGVSSNGFNPTEESLKQEHTFIPATDIYPVENDCIVFGCADTYNRFILMDSSMECKVISGIGFIDLNHYEAAFLKNDEGYYDVLTLGDSDLIYRFNSQKMTCTHNFEFLDYSDLSDIHNSSPQTAFRTEDGSYYSFGYIEVNDEILIFKEVPVIVKYSQNLERVAYQVYSFEYNSIFEAKQAGEYIVFAQEVHNLYDDSYINRLIVLDKDLNELFYKDYQGGCPVEVQAVGENLAVSVYKNGGSSSSYVEILDASGEEVTQIHHSLSYSRIYSDRAEGLYISGKQGKDTVNTVLRHYGSDIELLNETVFETADDEDKGFGLYFEINNEGKAIALQGNIANFPLYLNDKSSSENRFQNFENYFEQPIFAPPVKVELGDSSVLSETYKEQISVSGKRYVIFDTFDGNYLSAFDSNNEPLWKIRINGYGDSLYYIDGRILTVWGDLVNAFNSETGEQQWSMWLDDRVSAVSHAMINNKLYIIVDSNGEYGICTVDAGGAWEYFALPLNSYGTPQYDALKKDPETGEIYCIFVNEKGSTIVKLDDTFQATAEYYIENRNVEYFASNGRVYLSAVVFEEDTAQYNAYVLDENLNPVSTPKVYGYWKYVSSIDGVGFAYISNGSTYLADTDGNIIKQLAGASNAVNVFETDTGYAAVTSVVNNIYKLYEYNKDLKLVSVTSYDYETLLEKFPDALPRN